MIGKARKPVWRHCKINAQDIISNLKILGLEPGASPGDVRAAFRNLALEYHPDVAGSEGTFRFQQIMSAYTLLKALSDEELTVVNPQSRRAHDLYEENRVKRQARSSQIDLILEKYEYEIKNYFSHDESNLSSILFRLRSLNPKIRRIAVKHSGNVANNANFCKAITNILNRTDVDIETAELVGQLPFDDEHRRQLALDVCENSGALPISLIISLIGNDADLMEKYLIHVSPDAVAPILRRWPSEKIPGTNTIRILLDSDDPKVLVPVLSNLKQHFPQSATQHKKRLAELSGHHTAAVRAWARQLV